VCKIVHVAVQIVNDCIDRNIPINYLKVQKLAYLCQSFHLQKYGVPLAPEDTLNWSCGASYKEIYAFFKLNDLLEDSLTEHIDKNVDLLSFERETINYIINTYALRSFEELRDFTKIDTLFSSDNIGEIISTSSIKEHFQNHPL